MTLELVLNEQLEFISKRKKENRGPSLQLRDIKSTHPKSGR